ncbi:hypothetical protein BEL04_19395 [Mucilaginibacter sp. PPCGB 2223]|uniref:DUF3857 domain-containing protein n=1 Tax=Mucilaginibacter sp. PPCGB 2223 TaxID=1886027 RepID=UPI0008257169|nr:DUF3857 domain-containing protein [Mucilaginibacter sp. PPCGB 2223]OCX50891.1 hypothetical protein BEL04_19395 [Mucilaginibacter sp. PPCGB 2223]
MNLKPALLVGALFIGFNALAQKDPTYAQKAEEIKNKVWGDNTPEFAVKDIPADMQKESAVIIASSLNIDQTSNGKVKMSLFLPAGGTKTTKISTFRERVKINDKAALQAFSTIEYQKTLNSTTGSLYMKNIDKKDTYIGAKIIKPDGTEVIVNTDEEVLTKNEAKDKQGKLAVPNLQVGDILDYYITKVELKDVFNSDIKHGVVEEINNNYVWTLVDEYPNMSYSINLHYNKNIKVIYISANNAPDFKLTTLDNGDKIYSLQVKNMPKYDSNLWTATYRQYPYIQLTSSYSDTFPGFAKYDKNQSRLDNTIKTFIASFSAPAGYFDDNAEREVLKKYYKSGKELRNAPLDSSMAVLYNGFKYRTFCWFDNDMDMSTNRNARRLSSDICVVKMARMLHDLQIDFDILLVSPRTTSSLTNVFDLSDVKALIRINGGSQPLYMCFDDMFTQFNEIPESYQGEEAILLSPHKRALNNFDQGKTTIPVTGSDKNYINTSIALSLTPEDMQQVKITRTVNGAGALRHDAQENLIVLEDYEKYYSTILRSPWFAEILGKGGSDKKIKKEYAEAFAKARRDLQDNYKDEIRSEFDEEPKDLTFQVLNIGLTDPYPVFSYTGTFTMGNFVKTAGNNYILEVGKLIGPVTQVDEKQRQRNIDVYMPCARSFGYDININIPKGYQVKGVEELNKQVRNETAELSVVAKVNGDVLNVKINRSYTHNFEKAAQWPKLIEVIDAMYDLSKQKVLLQKI